MKIAALTCGPRGSGKTTYCHILNAYYPEIEIVSRDAYLISLYGNTILLPSNERMHRVNLLIIDRLKEVIQRSDKIIVDYWSPLPRARKNTIETLKAIGFEKVICLYFITPIEICEKWLQKKFDSDYYSPSSHKKLYDHFYERAGDVFQDGFDKVISINGYNPPTRDLNLF